MFENNLDLYKKENYIITDCGCFPFCLTCPFLFLVHFLGSRFAGYNCCPEAHLLISLDYVNKTAGR